MPFLIGDNGACTSTGDKGPNDDAGEPSDDSLDGLRAIDAGDDLASEDFLFFATGTVLKGSGRSTLLKFSLCSTVVSASPGDVAVGVRATADAERCSWAVSAIYPAFGTMVDEDEPDGRIPGLKGGLTLLCAVRGAAAMNSLGDRTGECGVGETEGDAGLDLGLISSCCC